MNKQNNKQKRREPTPEQKAAAEKRREGLRALAAHIKGMSEQDRQAMALQSPVVKLEPEGELFSPKNTCLLIMQKPDATVCGGFQQWLKQGRVPLKGTGLGIFCPTERKLKVEDSETGEETEVGSVTRFVFGTVFDISDTVEKQ